MFRIVASNMVSSHWLCLIFLYFSHVETSRISDSIQTELNELKREHDEFRRNITTKLNAEISTLKQTVAAYDSKIEAQDLVIAELTKMHRSCMKEFDVQPDDKNKRILLSDPNYLQNELNQIQVKLQEYEVVKSQVDSLQTRITQEVKGAVYIRWGRKDCPDGNTTELVYSGYAGGSSYEHSGAAADYVCLPPDPTWGPHQDIRSYAPAYMYGAEYEDPILFGVPDYKEDVPCAVCRNSYHSTTLMIPARTSCYPGWEEAYHGVLSAGANTHAAASQYVCVDETPQTLTGGGNTNGNGKLFYQVRTVCGSLQCPPYKNDKVLSCVVCLK